MPDQLAQEESAHLNTNKIHKLEIAIDQKLYFQSKNAAQLIKQKLDNSPGQKRVDKLLKILFNVKRIILYSTLLQLVRGSISEIQAINLK